MIAVEDIAYVRISAPDLDLMEKFLLDFGMQRAARTDAALYMSGYGPDPVVHVTEAGPPGHLGLAFKAQSRADLERLAAAQGVPIEQRQEPGLGTVVRLKDPDGKLVEVIHSFEPAPISPLRRPTAFNPAIFRSRHNEVVRVARAPSHVMRLGHALLHSANFPATFAFYRDVLGLRLSDSYFVGQPGNPMAAFLHCGLGERFTDHHTVALAADNRTGFDHFGFEVLDMDDLMMGNRHLKENHWEHSWGVGRHNDGSQIFDYWRDPWGTKIEHWTDGDLVNDHYHPTATAFTPETAADALAQWGPPLSPDFMR